MNQSKPIFTCCKQRYRVGKNVQKRIKNSSYECFQVLRIVATLKVGTIYNDASLLLHKRKDDSTQ